MGDRSSIEWTDATVMVDRDGRRVRTYQRQNPNRPGQQERRAHAAVGERWCRACEAWLPATRVSRGLCREHRNELARASYAANPAPTRARVHARKRGTLPVPAESDLVAELFGNQCAYCEGPHESWDHVVPVAGGGDSTPGNVVPACLSCNASKKDRDVYEWLEGRGRDPHPYLPEYLAMVEAA